MDEYISRPKPQESTWLWLWKIIGGLLIVFLLGLHFVVNHLVAPGGLLSYNDVVAYYQIPIIPILEGIFLLVVLSHSLIGLRSIILDLNPKPAFLRWLDIIIAAAGIVASIYGIWLLIVVSSQTPL